jgi:pimeloyl-ACP methyl ester carboxylesterase
MIVERVQVRQRIDRGVEALFDKQRFATRGPHPLSLVRKRLSGAPPRGADSESDACSAAVLLVHGFGQNRYTWHLPSRSFANYLASHGMDVFNVDLRGHGRSRTHSAASVNLIDEYVREDLPAAVDVVVRQSGKRQVFIVGHSLGGLIAYAGASAIRPSVAGIVSIGSPYHFARGSATLAGLARLSHQAMRWGGPVSRWIRSAPVPMAAIGWLLSRGRRLAESPLYPLPIRAWHPGTCEPHVLEEHLRLAFDRASFGEAVRFLEWARDKRFGGERYRYDESFESLDVPLLVVAGSRDKTFVAFPLGHIDLIMGRDAHLMTWPTVRKWIAARA